MHFGDNVCILGIFRIQDNANMHFGGYFKFMGIYRVYGDISSYHLHILQNNDRKSRDTSNFSTETFAQKVEMHESKLVPNCGQFHTLFSF